MWFDIYCKDPVQLCGVSSLGDPLPLCCVYCKHPVPWCGVSSLGDPVSLCGVVSTVKILCHGVVSLV